MDAGQTDGINQGGLKWIAEIDYSKLQQDARDIQETLSRIGDRAKTEASGITQAVDAAGTAAKRQMTDLDRIGSRLAGLMAGLASFSALKGFAESVANVREQMESLQSSFESLLGDAAKGDKLFADIRHMAATTPLSMGSLAQAAQTMLAFNISGEKIMPMLKALGDISMGDSARLQSLTLAFAQMSSAGHLMAQDLRQMISAGFNPLQEMSRTTGKSIAELTDEMSKGQITAQQVEQAFLSAAGQGGRFNGMLEKQSQGIRGAIQRLRTAWEDMLDDIGKSNEGPMVKVVDLATEMVKHYKAIGAVLATLVGVYGTYKTVIMACTVAETLKNLSTIAEAKSEAAATARLHGHTAAMVADTVAAKAATVAQLLLNAAQKAGPYLVVAAAITAVAVAAYKLTHRESEAAKEQKMLNDVIADSATKYAEEKANIDILFGKLKEAKKGTDEYRQARQAILDQYPEIASNQNKHISNLEDVAGAYKLVTDNAYQAAEAEAYEAGVKALNEQYSKDLEKDIEAANSWLDTVYAKNPRKNIMKGELDSALATGTPLAPEFVNNFRGGPGYNPMERIAKDVQDIHADHDQELQGLQSTPAYQAWLKQQQQDKPDTIQWPPANGGDTNTKDTASESAADIAREAQERQQAIIDAEADIIKTQRDAELDIRQQRIDLMDDSLDKTIARNKLNIDKLKADNENRLQEYVKQYVALRKAQWEQANPDAEKQGKTFEKDSGLDLNKLIQKNADGTLKSNDALLQKMLDQYNAYGKVIEQTRLNQQKEVYAQMLDGVQTFLQERADTIRKWDERIAQLRKASKEPDSGVTEGNVQQAEQGKQDALAQIDDTFADKSQQYQDWVRSLNDDTLEQLQDMLKKAKAALDTMKKNGVKDGKELATAYATVDKLEQAIKNDTPGDDKAAQQTQSMKRWQSLYQVLGEVDDQFSKLGGSIGGSIGEIMTSATVVASGVMNIVGGIESLSKGASAGITATSKTASGAIKGLEKASVILSIISAALQVAQKIAQLFNHDKQKQKHIDELQSQIDRLNFSLENPAIERLDERYGTVTQRIQDMFKATGTTARQAEREWDALQRSMSRAAPAQARFTRSAERLAQIYADMDYTADKAIGSKRYSEAADRLKNIAQQQLLIQRQIEVDQSKKKKNRKQEEEWREKQEELAKESADLINDMVDDIVGKSSNDIASELGDAFIEAFTKGEDAAQAWGDKVNDIVADILKRMLVQKFLEEPLGKMFDRYKKQWFPNGDGTMAIDNVMKTLPQFEKDLDGMETDFSTVIGKLPDKFKKQLESVGGSTVEASQKGIAQASQDSIDELNGRMTAVQEHTYHINENTRLIASNTHAILLSVMNIEGETHGMGDRLKRMETSLGTVSTALSDMSVKGVTLKTRV